MMINILAIGISIIVVLIFVLQFLMWVQKKLFKTVNYTIKQGKHYCSNWLPFIIGYNIDKLSYYCTFDENCVYDESELEFSGVNKLPGITRLKVHGNSYRWGWRAEENGVMLYSYCYDKGERYISDIALIEYGKTYKLSIFIGMDNVVFALNDFVSQIDYLETQDDMPFSYINKMYFGGKSTAPHTMNATVKYLNYG